MPGRFRGVSCGYHDSGECWRAFDGAVHVDGRGEQRAHPDELVRLGRRAVEGVAAPVDVVGLQPDRLQGPNRGVLRVHPGPDP